MRKLLIFASVITSLILTACSTIENSSLIYRPTIIQGNTITQKQLSQLKPGMSKQQVRSILGSPTLEDTFHANRWDYNYTQGIGSTPETISLLSVYFANNQLVRVIGDRQRAESAQQTMQKPTVVKVPDWQPQETSFWHKTLESTGLGENKDN